MVAKAATFHATHDPTTVTKRSEEAWKALIGLTNKEIINLAAHDVPAFTARLRDIVAYRPSLNLPQTEYDDLDGLASLAIEWVSQSIDAPANTGATQAVVPATPPLERNNDQTFADRDFPFLDITQSHRPRAIRTPIALNNLPEHLSHPKIVPHHRRLKKITQDRLPPPDVCCEVFRGPGILVGFLNRSNSVSHYISKQRFPPLDNGRPGSAEYEAVSLARSLDLRMAAYPTALHFLASDLGAEVDLRRLYAILKVETMVCQGWMRGDAWIKQTQMLETAPETATTYQDLDEEVNNAYSVIQKENYYRRASSYNRSSSYRGRGRGRGGRGGSSAPPAKRTKTTTTDTAPAQEN